MSDLYYEVLACIAAAAIIGLFCGWMMKHSGSKRKLKSVNRKWQGKYNALLETNEADMLDSEDRIKALANDLREQHRINRELEEQIRFLESHDQAQHAAALQHNKNTTEAQSRMQQLLHAKASALLASEALEVETETFDQTVRLDPDSRHREMPAVDEYDDEFLDETTVLADSSFDTEESTIALDAATLEALTRSSKS